MMEEETTGCMYAASQGGEPDREGGERWAVQALGNGLMQADADGHTGRQCESLKMEEVNEVSCGDKLNRSNCPEKTVYVLGVVYLIVVVASAVSFRWFLPYFYTVLLAVLIPIRAWKYSTMKWQFFLFDWCYIANVLNLIYLWGMPHQPSCCLLLYSICNGTVAWSVVLFRNCLVPHSIERMTCLTIHLLPALVAYVVRWHPAEASLHWYRAFPSDLSQEGGSGGPVDVQFIWVVAIPMACYLGHLILYISVFHWIVGPSEYLNNYSYLVYQGEGWITGVIKCYKNGKCKLMIYLLLQVAYASLSTLLTLLWFNFQVANIVFLCALFLLITYNGSTYYLDLYPKRGFNSDPYRLCGKH